MSIFLSALPLWAALLLLVVLPTLVAMAGPVFMRRRFGQEHMASNNEIAGFKFATVGVIYSVLVAFAVIVVWEKFNDAETAVAQEAGAAATFFRLAAGDEPRVTEARAALKNYLELAMDREWPAMAREDESAEVTRALTTLYGAAVHLTEAGSTAPAVLAEMFKQLDSITQARRARLHLATGIVPAIVWLVLFSGAILTVGFTFFFGAKNLHAQVVMTGILSTLVFIALFVVVSIDHPFTGPTSVDSAPLRAVVADFAQ